jgi:probable F420-dependent oxidoreductase
VSTPLPLSVTISGFTRIFGGRLRAVLDAARAADAAGIDQLVVPDHVVMGARTDRYPYGQFPYGPEEPWPEPLTLLAAIGGVTERVRVGTGILISPLRPAVVLAKTVGTLDGVTGGRLDLGVGIGWQREEYDACGVRWGARRQVFDDQLRACAALWTQPPPVSFSATTVAFTDMWCEPRPVQQVGPAGVPLWFGVPATDEHVARVAELGTGWLPIHTTTDDHLRAGVDALRAAFTRAGRDPTTLGVRASLPLARTPDGTIDLGATRARAEELRAMGVTTFSVGLGRSVRDPDGVREFLAALSRLANR